MEIIKNFANSVSTYIASGFKHVDQEIKTQRLDICKQCEHFKNSTYQCDQCGCFLMIKTGWATEKCPIGKWFAVEESDTQSSFPETIKPQVNIQSFENLELKDCGCNKK